MAETTKVQIRRGGFRQPPQVLEFIASLNDAGIAPKQISDRVEKAFPGQHVSSKTVLRIREWQQQRRVDPEPWSLLSDVDGVDPALTLPAVAALLHATDGRRRQLTIGEARSVTRIRRAAPDIPIETALRVAWMYPRTTPPTVLDEVLAFAPWRGAAERSAYLDAIERGWLPSWSPGMPWAQLAATAEQESPESTTPPVAITKPRKGGPRDKKGTR